MDIKLVVEFMYKGEIKVGIYFIFNINIIVSYIWYSRN